jgi:2-oxoisovalerate dehydrogenase E1 component
VSVHDPVTGGVHCSIGSRQNHQRSQQQSRRTTGNDYIVTSTLASQCPSAVGRALAYSLVVPQQSINDDDNTHDDDDPSQSSSISSLSSSISLSRPISFVSVGDGSVHHSHFWSAFHLARHARHTKHIHCPIVFAISDNGLSISYNTGNYVNTLFRHDPLIPYYPVNGNNILDVYTQTQQAVDYARKYQAPVMIHYTDLIRRFGHAATDRQSAYLSLDDITKALHSTVVEDAIQQLMNELTYHITTTTATTTTTEESNHDEVFTYHSVLQRYYIIEQMTVTAFTQAMNEPKINRQPAMDRLFSVPSSPRRRDTRPHIQIISTNKQPVMNDKDSSINMKEEVSNQNPELFLRHLHHHQPSSEKLQVMRKHMTRVIAEVMEADKSVVYIGEDVEHGGYYLVTDGLRKRFGAQRVIDFPPDETSLLGAAMGMSQMGLTPIVEIPYAKFLSCGCDMWEEIAMMQWLSNGQQPNGMVVRIQGFDRGIFGGNFHTHNSLQLLNVPGVDVVCYSNGRDYVQGFRTLVQHAKAGRVVVSVDCTYLLNLKHLYGNDRAWESVYPSNIISNDDTNNMDTISFDDIRVYRYNKMHSTAQIAIVTYGNGVVSSLQARRRIYNESIIACESEIDVIDCPYLSRVPNGLMQLLAIQQYHRGGILFADICKQGPATNALSSHIMELQQARLLPPIWDFIGAPRTYNPLGSTVTFLNVDDIFEGAIALMERISEHGVVDDK